MKKQGIRFMALLIFASVALSSCSIQYRERHRRDRDHDGDHHYRNYNN